MVSTCSVSVDPTQRGPALAWFSIGMFITAFPPSVAFFGIMRLITGRGLGALLATAGATMAEFAPAGKRNFYNAIVYSGIPAGGVLAAVLGLGLLILIGWRGLFMIGATPILFLFRWPRPSCLSPRAGCCPVVGSTKPSPSHAAPGIPPSEHQQFGGVPYGLVFLLLLNGGAVVGGLIASRLADEAGPQRVIASTFALAALTLFLMTFGFPIPLLLVLIAVAGVSVLGTQVLIYGFTSNHYGTNVRAAGVAWCSGFGRLDGIFGPLVGGWLAAAGMTGSADTQLPLRLSHLPGRVLGTTKTDPMFTGYQHGGSLRSAQVSS